MDRADGPSWKQLVNSNASAVRSDQGTAWSAGGDRVRVQLWGRDHVRAGLRTDREGPAPPQAGARRGFPLAVCSWGGIPFSGPGSGGME